MFATLRRCAMGQAGFQVVEGTAPPAGGDGSSKFQTRRLDAYVATWVVPSSSNAPIANRSGALPLFPLFPQACRRLAWEATRDNVDRVDGELAGLGMMPLARRGCLRPDYDPNWTLKEVRISCAERQTSRSNPSTFSLRVEPHDQRRTKPNVSPHRMILGLELYGWRDSPLSTHIS